MANTTDNTKKSVIETTVTMAGDMVNGGLKLEFIDGRVLQLQLNDVQAILEQAALHGLKQKLVDAAAISRNPENGRAATVEDKYNAVKEVFDRLLSGEWNKTREGGVSGGLLFLALCRMYEGKKTTEDIRAYLETKTDAEKTALRKNPKVATIIETIRAEKGKPSNVDTDELLSELDD